MYRRKKFYWINRLEAEWVSTKLCRLNIVSIIIADVRVDQVHMFLENLLIVGKLSFIEILIELKFCYDKLIMNFKLNQNLDVENQL